MTTDLLPFQQTVTDLLSDTELDFGGWEDLGHQLDELEANGPWMAVDWLLYGEQNFKDSVIASSEIFRRLGPSKRAKYRFCGRMFPPHRRRRELTYSHHETVMYVQEALQEELLDLAVDTQMSVKDLASELRSRKATDEDKRSFDGMDATEEENRQLVERQYQRAWDIAETAKINPNANVSVPKAVFLEIVKLVPKPPSDGGPGPIEATARVS